MGSCCSNGNADGGSPTGKDAYGSAAMVDPADGGALAHLPWWRRKILTAARDRRPLLPPARGGGGPWAAAAREDWGESGYGAHSVYAHYATAWRGSHRQRHSLLEPRTFCLMPPPSSPAALTATADRPSN